MNIFLEPLHTTFKQTSLSFTSSWCLVLRTPEVHPLYIACSTCLFFQGTGKQLSSMRLAPHHHSSSASAAKWVFRDLSFNLSFMKFRATAGHVVWHAFLLTVSPPLEIRMSCIFILAKCNALGNHLQDDFQEISILPLIEIDIFAS